MTSPSKEYTPFRPVQNRRQSERLAKAAFFQSGSPASVAARRLSTIQSKPGPICP